MFSVITRDNETAAFRLTAAEPPRPQRGEDIVSLGRALDAIPTALLIVGGDRRVVIINRAARTLGDGCLSICYGRLCGFSGAASSPFDAVLQDACGGQRATVTVATGHGRGADFWRVWFSPLARDLVPAEICGLALVLLGVEPPPARASGLAPVERLFALTSAETRVLKLLLEDRSPRQIAAELGVAITTVRSHLAALFSKTGTRRQSELVRVAISAALR